MNTLDLLLRMDIPQPETKEYKIKRLSKLCGEDVVFILRELGFSRVAEIKQMSTGEDTAVQTVLAGVTAPNFKDKALLEKYGVLTPDELVKKMLKPGEIEELSREIERLSGYRMRTIEEIKKK